jgi:hypothetical protein
MLADSLGAPSGSSTTPGDSAPALQIPPTPDGVRAAAHAFAAQLAAGSSGASIAAPIGAAAGTHSLLSGSAAASPAVAQALAKYQAALAASDALFLRHLSLLREQLSRTTAAAGVSGPASLAASRPPWAGLPLAAGALGSAGGRVAPPVMAPPAAGAAAALQAHAAAANATGPSPRAGGSGAEYTTLAATKAFIEARRRPGLSYEEALARVRAGL